MFGQPDGNSAAANNPPIERHPDQAGESPYSQRQPSGASADVFSSPFTTTSEEEHAPHSPGGFQHPRTVQQLVVQRAGAGPAQQLATEQRGPSDTRVAQATAQGVFPPPLPLPLPPTPTVDGRPRRNALSAPTCSEAGSSQPTSWRADVVFGYGNAVLPCTGQVVEDDALAALSRRCCELHLSRWVDVPLDDDDDDDNDDDDDGNGNGNGQATSSAFGAGGRYPSADGPAARGRRRFQRGDASRRGHA